MNMSVRIRIHKRVKKKIDNTEIETMITKGLGRVKKVR